MRDGGRVCVCVWGGGGGGGGGQVDSTMEPPIRDPLR